MAEVYEVELNGETYEVEAPSQDEAVKAAEYMAGRRAEVAPRQAYQRSLPGRFVRGVKDVPRRVLESIQQLGTAVGEATGLMAPGSVEEQTLEQNMRRVIATGGDPAAEEAADLGELVVLGIPVGAGVGFGARTVTTSLAKALGKTAGVSAGTAALTMPASETAGTPGDVFAERATAAGLSLGVTGAVAAVAALRPAVHNFMVGLKQRTEQNAQTVKQRLAAGRWLEGPRGTLTVSQQTGSDVARSLEIQVKATQAQNFLNEQVEQQMSRWEALNRWVGKGSGMRPKDTSFLTTARDLSKAWTSSEATAQAAASRAYGQQMSQVVNLASKDPTFFPVKFDNLGAAAEEIAVTSGGKWWRSLFPGAKAATGPIAQLDKYLESVRTGPGLSIVGLKGEGLSVTEIVRLRRALNEMDSEFYTAIKSSPDVDPALLQRHRALTKVIRAVDADIEATVASLPPNSLARDALGLYVEANKQYHQFKDLQDFMRQTATAQWFGGFQPADAQKFLVRLGQMEPAQQVLLVNTLQAGGEAGKLALHKLRMGLVQQALEKAKQVPTRAASAGEIDLHRIGTAMMGDLDVLGSRIFAPKQLAEIKRGLAAIRVLEEAPTSVSVNRAPSVESGVMAAGSMSMPFLARVAWRAMGGPRLEALLFSKEGLKSLDVLADLRRALDTGGIPKSRAPQIAAAITYVANATGVAEEMPPELAAELAQYLPEEDRE